MNNIDTFLLEYDDERSGTFEPLAKMPDDKMVVLGLISSKSTMVEPVEEIAARVSEAAKYVDLERLALSPSAGSPRCPSERTSSARTPSSASWNSSERQPATSGNRGYPMRLCRVTGGDRVSIDDTGPLVPPHRVGGRRPPASGGPSPEF
jgi:cobalamin-independent methionine synthase catalytic subunit